jgi:hypothetical protein
MAERNSKPTLPDIGRRVGTANAASSGLSQLTFTPRGTSRGVSPGRRKRPSGDGMARVASVSMYGRMPSTAFGAINSGSGSRGGLATTTAAAAAVVASKVLLTEPLRTHMDAPTQMCGVSVSWLQQFAAVAEKLFALYTTGEELEADEEQEQGEGDSGSITTEQAVGAVRGRLRSLQLVAQKMGGYAKFTRQNEKTSTAASARLREGRQPEQASNTFASAKQGGGNHQLTNT